MTEAWRYPVTRETQGPIQILRFRRHDKHAATSSERLVELRHAFQELGPEVRVVGDAMVFAQGGADNSAVANYITTSALPRSMELGIQGAIVSECSRPKLTPVRTPERRYVPSSTGRKSSPESGRPIACLVPR